MTFKTQTHPSPLDRPLDTRWKNSWRAFGLAFGMRNSFGLALSLGAMALLLQIIGGYVGFALSTALSFAVPLPRMVIDMFGPLGGTASLFFTYFLSILYLASRFMDPEIKVFGGLQNIRLGRALGFATLLSLAVGLVTTAIFWILDRFQGDPWPLAILLGLVAAGAFLFLAVIATRHSLKWPESRAQARTPIYALLNAREFLGHQALLGMAIWATWALLTGTSIAVCFGLGFSGGWMALFVLIPFFIILISGYTMMLFAAAFIAPFRVAGWTLTKVEDLSSVFD